MLGNFSGRNSGDAAILGGLLRDLTETFPNTPMHFRVPTIKPSFVRDTYREFPVEPISLLPTNLSLKILGLPVIRSVLSADLVLVTDAILFDRRLYNPLFNYLHTLSWVLPWGARRNVPVVLYNVSLGPIKTEAGCRALQRVLSSAERVILRDQLSKDLAAELGLDGPELELGADCALSALPAPDSRVDQLAKRHGVLQSDRPVLGFNVNVYLDVYVRGNSPGIGAEHFRQIVSSVLDRAISELGVDVLLFVTQPMDLGMAKSVMGQVSNQDRISLVANPQLSYSEIAGFLGRVEALVGMRTHSLILASSMHTPVAGIIAYPKNKGYLDSIDRGDGMLEFSDFDHENLWQLVKTTWEQRQELRKRFSVSVERERAKARASATKLERWLAT